MKEVLAPFVLLAVSLTKVYSNHCITGDHIRTYDNIICLSGVGCPWSGVPPICSFSYPPSGTLSDCGCQSNLNNCNSGGNCAFSGNCATCGICTNNGNCGSSGNCSKGPSTCGPCRGNSDKCRKVSKCRKTSAAECGLGAWNLYPSGFGCGCPGPKTTCCTQYPAPCGCPKTTCCTSFPSVPLPPCGCPRSCCSGLPPCCNFPSFNNFPSSGCGFPIEISPCGLASAPIPTIPPPCGCPLPKTTTCTTIPFGNPICGKTTTCTTYPNPCGKSTTTCITVPHANPACAKTTTCQSLPLDPCFPCCNPCGSLCGKSCSSCCSSIPGKCGNPLCKCGYCTCPSPCNCGYY